MAHVQVSKLFQGCNTLHGTFRVENIVSLLRQKVVTFSVKELSHFASKVVAFRVTVTFRVKSCYISRCCYIFRQLLHFAA